MSVECFTGYVSKLYRGCPKTSGWNGWFFELDDGRQLRCTMKHGGWIHSNMYLTIVATQVPDIHYNDSYEVEKAEVAKTQQGIISYLSSSDFPGVGLTTAKKLYTTFGKSVLDILDYEPEKLKTAGISDKTLDLLVKGRMQHSVGNLLRLLDLKPAMIEKIREKYGDAALKTIQANPYQLLYDFKGERGFNFKTVDKVALGCGIAEDDPRRLDEAVYYGVDNWLSSGGHICGLLNDPQWFENLRVNTQANLGTKTLTSNDLRKLIQKSKRLVVRKYTVGNQDLELCYTEDSYLSEQGCATNIARLVRCRPLCNLSESEIRMMIEDYELLSGVQLDAVQQDAVITSLTNRLSIITGGPGCGKTTVVACVSYIWRRSGRPEPIFAAPTGLAVKKLHDSIVGNCSGYGSDIKVKTIARMLIESMSHGDSFAFDPTLVIIDETSMVNLADAWSLLKRIKYCHVIFVGDADQLPSIDPGDFFANLCALDCIPKNFLNICYRAVSAQVIMNNSHKIKDGVPTDFLDWSSNAFKFQMFVTDTPNSVQYLVDKYLAYIRRGYKYSELCILSPTKKYLMGVGHLNIVLQAQVNPERPVVFTRVFGEELCDTKGCPIEDTDYYVSSLKERTQLRIGDRVIYSKNRYELGLVNGDCGIIQSYHKPDKSEKYLVLELDDGRIVELEAECFADLQLAYAVTIHKAQGCEYQHVLISSPDMLASYQQSIYEADSFATRNLLYTASTRAKASVEFVGSKAFLDRCIATQRPPRLTLLPYRILESV